MELIIKQELAQKIANYLQSRPYVEVAQLLAEMQEMEKVKEEEKC